MLVRRRHRGPCPGGGACREPSVGRARAAARNGRRPGESPPRSRCCSARYALWIQFHGPLAEHGSPWLIAQHGNGLGAFVNPQAQLLFHTASSAAYAASHGANAAEYLAYLGPPLLILVAGSHRSGTGATCGSGPPPSPGRCLKRCRSASTGRCCPSTGCRACRCSATCCPPAVHPGGRRRRGGARVRARPGPVARAPARGSGSGRRTAAAAAPRRAGGGRAARGPAAGAASGGRGHRSAGAGRLGHRVHPPAPAGERERARRARPVLAAGRGDALAGRRPASRAAWSRAGSSAPFRPAAPSPRTGGRASPMRPCCASTRCGRAPREPRLRHGRAAALGYWHPAAVVADTRPGTPLGRFLIGFSASPPPRTGSCSAGAPQPSRRWSAAGTEEL